jgi:hypothetical protein
MGVWLALVLLPIFSEVELFGMKFKADLERVRHDVSELRSEVRNAVMVQSSFSPTLNLGPAPDALLAQLADVVKQEMARHAPGRATSMAPQSPDTSPMPTDAIEAFRVRYQLDRVIGRLAESRFDPLPTGFRAVAPRFQGIVQSLVGGEVLSQELGAAARELYAVCSAAIHGQQLTAAQAAFMREVAPTVLAALNAL